MMRKQDGFLAMLMVAIVIIGGIIAVAASYLFTSSTRSASDHLQSTQAFYLAESALEDATHELLGFTLANRVACSGLSLTNSAFGNGAYTVTSSGPFYTSSATTLNGALTATATSITVVSTANYQSSGRIMIDQELINYSSVDATHFLGVTRGVDSSIATTHVSGAPVGQYQCTLSAQGGVPNLAALANPGDPSGKRLLQESVQLQEGWAVGANSGGAFTFIRWNRPTERAWNNAVVSSGSNTTLMAVSMISYVDGWAVGNTARFLHWNGSTWTLTTVTPSVNYTNVFCIASNDCYAVGATNGGRSTILDWNGAAWTRVTTAGVNGNNALQGLNCDSSTDCWAVGATNTFYQWNGTSWTGISEAGLSGFTFNSVFCNSSTDCWAVGANATFARKNGATWANFATGLPSTTYNSVFCNSSSDCWAVGNVNGGRDLFVHWNGSAWSRDASNPTPTANLNKVTCANANDCWAVGANSRFVHWDGSSWTQFATSGLPSVTLQFVALVNPNSEPQSAWQEIYP